MMALVVRIVIFNKGKVLVGLRSKPDKSKSNGKWQLPGGHIEDGEMIFEAAVRETNEETGLKIKKLTALPLMIEQKKDNKIVLSVVAELAGGRIKKQTPEHSVWRWIDKKDIDKVTFTKSTYKILYWYFENYG